MKSLRRIEFVSETIVGMSGEVFLLAFHELIIMWFLAFILEMFVVERLARKLAFRLVTPGQERPIFITLAISSMIVCLMCPTMRPCGDYLI